MPKRPPIFRPPWAPAPKQREKQYDQDRGSASSRGYGHGWRKLRLLKLKTDPVCETEGCGEPANEVDHRTPKRKGGTDDWENLQSLCKSCHSKKTGRGE